MITEIIVSIFENYIFNNPTKGKGMLLGLQRVQHYLMLLIKICMSYIFATP